MQVFMNEEADSRVNQDAFKAHDKKQKELVRKRGPSIQAKTLRLGQAGELVALSLYQDPSTGSWHLSVHCPAGISLPDLNALVHSAPALAQNSITNQDLGRTAQGDGNRAADSG